MFESITTVNQVHLMERLMDTQHEDAKYVVRFYKQEMEWKKKNLKGTIEKKDDVYNKGKMKEKANIAFGR